MTRLAPDTATRIALIGTTERLCFAKGDRDAAIAELQRTAGGRTDLLAQAAGHFLGGETWNRDACYRLLLDAGAHPDAAAEAAKVTAWNLSNYGHTSAGTAPPGRRLDR